MKTMKLSRIAIWVAVLALLAIACSASTLPGQVAQNSTGEPANDPSTEPTKGVVFGLNLDYQPQKQQYPSDQGGLQEITVENVTVQIGVGSPIPVDAVISGTWPGLCAQLAEVKQQPVEWSFDISLLATADGPNCPPDHLGLPFRIAIPLNMAEKPFGTYSVTANGVKTTFVWDAKPTVSEPAPAETPNEPAADAFSFEGIRFTLDPAVTASASGQVVPENPGSSDSPYWEINPQYVNISLTGYPQVKTMYNPAISIYPVEDYRKLSPEADKRLNELKDILVQKPADAEQIPFLPVTNAGQVFHSNLKYLDFQNGSGVRFLTIYAQYVAPVNNQDLFYTFQGLTADGRYFVSATLPVNHPSLRADLNAFSTAELDAIVKDYDQYRSDVAAALAAQPGNSFTPDLEKLDALIVSLAIEK